MSDAPKTSPESSLSAAVIPAAVLAPWILITCCFSLWGFANDVTNPMVKAFSKIFLTSNFQGALVQFAFYGGYFAMAFPAAIIIKKTTYKTGVLLGLGLYAFGSLLFIPAASIGLFWPFLIAYFILTCGLSFLETGCNPYIMAMGSEETATQRLNFSQAFNPIGSLMGMYVATTFVIARLDPADRAAREAMSPDAFAAVKAHDLGIVRMPYVAIGLVLLVFFAMVAVSKMPRLQDSDKRLDLGGTFSRLFANKKYIEGVVAQFFYVGAQIMCWTFIIHYGAELFTQDNPSKLAQWFTGQATPLLEQEAETLATRFNIAAMILFVSSRFVCTFSLKYFKPGALLAALAVGGTILTMGTILAPEIYGLLCLVGVSACMSLMFPTIYGIALKGLGDDAKLGAAGLIMAILGGSVLTPLQGLISDMESGLQLGAMEISPVRLSFILPAICFVVIAAYGARTHYLHQD